MWKPMAALSIAVLSGCVSTGEYQNLEAKYEHQLEVKEFMETDGQLPKSIEWVANSDLPPNTFPNPNDAVAIND